MAVRGLLAHKGPLVLMFACLFAVALGVREGWAQCNKPGYGNRYECSYVGYCPRSVGCLLIYCGGLDGYPPGAELVCSGAGWGLETCDDPP